MLTGWDANAQENHRSDIISTTISPPFLDARTETTTAPPPVQEAIRFPMLQLNDARVQRIIHGRTGYLDFKGSQAPILCRIILPRRITPETFAGAQAHGKTAHRAVRLYVFS